MSNDKEAILQQMISLYEKQLKDKDKIITDKDKEIDRLKSIINQINFLSKI